MNGEYSVAVVNEVKAKARNPAGDARELVDLVIAYAKQETLQPLKGLGKKAALGLGGALLLGIGGVFVSIGALRAMQTETEWFEEHNAHLPAVPRHRGPSGRPVAARLDGPQAGKEGQVKGNGSGRITRADIEAKLRAIRDDIEPVGDQAKGGLMAAAPVVAAVLVIGAYILGKRSGKKRRAVIEIKRL